MIDEKVLIERLEEESAKDTNVLTNNGWIPCSERLPECAGDYLVTQYNQKAKDEYYNGCRTSTIFFDSIEWWDVIDFSDGWEIIAWQPLPQPYQSKGEQ